MKRIEIIALHEDRKKIVERLQRRGIIEFNDCRDESVAKMDTASAISQFEKNIAMAIQTKAILEEYAPVKKSLLASLNERKEIEKHHFGEHVGQREEYIKNCYDIIHFHKIITDSRIATARTQSLMDSLRIWLDLDIPMKYKGTKHTRCFIGTLPKQHTREDILVELAQRNPQLEMIHVEVISTFKEQTCIAVICHSDIAGETNETLRQMGFVFPSDPTKHEPEVRMKRYEADLVKYQTEVENSIQKIRTYADRMDEIEFLTDYFVIRKDKYIALNRLGLTKRTFIITGYIPEKYSMECVRELEERFTVSIDLKDPGAEEDVPVLLENGPFVSPVESITEMYALPAKNDIDPSPVMAFFYYLFFGIMLSDAGYGLVMIILTTILLKKVNVKESMKKTLKMFFFCGISTVFWGALFGSWFGDIIPIIYEQFLHLEAPKLALWFDPISNPIKFLLAAFCFGIIHLFVGLAVHFKICWSEGRKTDAVFDVIPVYLFILGVAPLAGSVLVSIPAVFSEIGKYMALTGVVLIILTAGRASKNIFVRLGGGVYGFYNIAAGYLSDVLSYSRLLALGLATGSIAGVINLMGSMPSNLVFKGILLTIVFLVGHPLNMAINLLGAYVHSNRLEFVEFFSKFYEGGGRAFHPLKINSKYIKFKEDN